MPEPEDIPPYRPIPTWVRGFAHAIEVCESALFAFFATVVTLGFLGVALFVTHDGIFTSIPARQASRVGNVVACAVLLAWFVLDPAILWRVWQTMGDGEHPVAVFSAGRQRPYPLLLRLPIALWWLAHFGVGIGLVLAGHAADNDPRVSHGSPTKPAISYFMAFVFTLAANGYLLNAVAALGARQRALARVWHWRIVIDLGLVVASWAIDGAVATPRH